MDADGHYTLNSVTFDRNILRATLEDPLECRWLDDSYDNEFVYFTFPDGNSPASQISFAGVNFKRGSK